MAAQMKDQWPTDANEAARAISHHVFVAFSDSSASAGAGAAGAGASGAGTSGAGATGAGQTGASGTGATGTGTNTGTSR